MTARRIDRLELTVTDLDRVTGFFVDAFGATVAAAAVRRSGERFARTVGFRDAASTVVVLDIGGTRIELHRFDRPGRPCPPDARANDGTFQHFALVTRDAEAAWARARACGASPIGADRTTVLPPASGGVRAIKFRDPEGHPLELLEFPPAGMPQRWRDATTTAPVLGIDHTAIAVVDTGRAERFYAAVLGLVPIARSLNVGPGQEALDGTFNAVVEVTGLAPVERGGPHLELLCNRVPADGRPTPLDWRADDVLATRTVWAVDRLDDAVAAAMAAGARFVSPRALAGDGDDPATATLSDPDGHLLRLEQRAVDGS